MTKREIINWLKRKKEDTLYELQQETKKLKKTVFDNKYKELGLKEFEKETDLKLNEIFKAYTEKFSDNTMYVDYNGFKARLQYLINNLHETLEVDVKHSLNRFCDINKKEAVTRDKITQNYDNLIYNVRNISKVEDIVEYLKSLGIELPKDSKVKEQITTVAVPINVDYLFLNINKGENNAENN